MELGHIAKPYSTAIYRIAYADSTLEDWSNLLQAGAALMSDRQSLMLFATPKISQNDKRQIARKLFEQVLKRALNDAEMRFIELLLKRHRLQLLPDILIQFNHLIEQHSSEKQFHVLTPYPLNDQQQQILRDKLSTRFNCQVKLAIALDEHLIGGIVIKQGDRVIDLSITAQLNELKQSLTI